MSDDLTRLLAPDTSPAEALRLFTRLRATPEEGRAIHALLARSSRTPLHEPLLVAVASALVDRGEDDVAARALGERTSGEALMLRAELAARGGDLPSAVALVERVMLRDLDWPGARERRARWRTALGLRDRAVPEPSAATVMTATPSAPFRLVREVGRGSAGAVYEAEDAELGRRVALKVYHRPDRDRVQLLHEARVAVALAGPGVVRVLDVDPEHGWLAMEWAAMGALRALLRARGPELSPLHAWVSPLVDALARVHAAGWVHHDVKPANLLLRAEGEPLLTDFGIARRVGEPSPPGSLGYVSPERLAGRASDPRDDVFALGRVLDEALEAVPDDGVRQRWQPIVAACTGPDSSRPADASGVALLLR